MGAVTSSTVRGYVLDSLRKQRNLSDYDGEPVSQALLSDCVEQAQRLLALAQARWSSSRHFMAHPNPNLINLNSLIPQ
jgi:hypothetical protein